MWMGRNKRLDKASAFFVKNWDVEVIGNIYGNSELL